MSQDAIAIGILERLNQIARRYPPLFHYASDENLLRIVGSKSLAARRILDFRKNEGKDVDEYILGLNLIRQRIVERSFTKELDALPSTRDVLDRYFPSRAKLVDMVLAHIDHDLRELDQPLIDVYVACLTTDPESERMKKEYGKNAISFNPILPAIAYSVPAPFSFAMLSRVSYSELEFRAKLILGFDLTSDLSATKLNSALKRLDPEAQRQTLSVWVAERLACLAPNIKGPDFEWEREWRLKSVRSHFGTMSFAALQAKHAFTFFQLPDIAKFIEEPSPRYLHELTTFGKMIIDGVRFGNPIDAQIVREFERLMPAGPRIGLHQLPAVIAKLRNE